MSEIVKLTFEEIVGMLQAEGIRYKSIVFGDKKPDWLGEVRTLYNEHNEQTKSEWENIKRILHLVAHDLYIEANGTKEKNPGDEKKKWRFNLEKVNRVTEEIPAQPAYTKVSYNRDYSSPMTYE